MDRIILHVDINNCFASIEEVLNPELHGKPIAVCGAEEERHGIVLAKSEGAKKYFVRTGETIWQAKRKCPQLIIVMPHYGEYMRYCARVRRIYESYTDQVEPFGMDECWLDVTNSTKLFGGGEQIAQDIRKRVKRELGITVSVGVSFSKVFAKLGSDLKKPDAVTVIGRKSYLDKIGTLPANVLMGVGKSAVTALNRRGIFTIADIIAAGPEAMKRFLGKNGLILWLRAGGIDDWPVMKSGSEAPLKSVSSGITGREDFVDAQEVGRVMLSLSGDVSKRLRDAGLCACGVQLGVRSSKLLWRQYQRQLDYPVQSACELYSAAYKLLERYDWQYPVRSLSVRATGVRVAGVPMQEDMLGKMRNHDKCDKADEAVYEICKRYGSAAVRPASLLIENKMPCGDRISCLPGPAGVAEAYKE